MIERTEIFISHLLRWGVIASGAIIGFGWLLSLLPQPRSGQNGAWLETLIHGHATQSPFSFHTASEFLHALGTFHPNAWMALGISFLIALPILRVALTFAAFFIAKDRIYVMLSGMVLAILTASILLGKHI